MSTGARIIPFPDQRAARAARGARVLAVTGGKGGVGKSFISANLAIACAGLGQRTLAVDADFGMADLNLLYGLAPDLSVLDLLHGEPIDEILCSVHGVTVLPALNGSYRLANMDAPARAVVMKAIDSLEERFDTVVLDLPAGIDETTVQLSAAASHVVVVLAPEPTSLADAYATLKTLALQHDLQRAYVVPNGMPNEAEAHDGFSRLRTLVDRFLRIELVRLPTVPWDANVRIAGASGTPLVTATPDCPASRAIRFIARELLAAAPARAATGACTFFPRRTGAFTPAEAEG